MKEIVNKLHESRQIQLAKEILESNGYKVSKKSIKEAVDPEDARDEILNAWSYGWKGTPQKQNNSNREEEKSVYKKYNIKSEDDIYNMSDEEAIRMYSELDEGIFGFGKKKSSSSSGSSGKSSKVTFKVYDPNGTLQFNQTFEEIPGKKNAEEQMKATFKDASIYRTFKSNNPGDWTYERVSNPPSTMDTKRGRNYFLSDIGIY